MEITFKTRRLSRTFGSDRELRREYGDTIASAIRIRLAVLTNAPALTQVPTTPPERRHRLSNNRKEQYAIDLDYQHRLIFEPHNPVPLQEDGGVDTDRVTAITIIEVVNYH